MSVFSLSAKTTGGETKGTREAPQEDGLRPCGASEFTSQSRRHRRHGFSPWAGKIPQRRNGSRLQYSCLEKFHRQGSLPVHCPWDHKEPDNGWTRTQHNILKECRPYTHSKLIGNHVLELMAVKPLIKPSWVSTHSL